MEDKQIRKVETTPLAESSNIGELLRIAVEKNIDVDRLERLQQMYYADQDRAAKAAYIAAMSHFRELCPLIHKTQAGQHATTSGGIRKGFYAPLDQITKAIDKVLPQCGLSYRWGDAMIADGKLTRACIVSHVAGHSESSSMTVPVDSAAGSSPQQKYGSADTYARRYSLIAVLGLSTCDYDNDADVPASDEKLSADQIAQLTDVLNAVGANVKRFCLVYGVERVEDIPAFQYDAALRFAESKRK